MNAPGSVREALIAEAIGDLGRMIDQAQALQRAMAESRQALVDAQEQLTKQLAAFEVQVLALSEKAKVQAVKHLLARTDEAARRSAESQARTMAEAARVAFGAEFGATLQRLQSALQPLRQPPGWLRESWLTHAAAASTASALTWVLAVLLVAR